jgi:hypothetical protein
MRDALHRLIDALPDDTPLDILERVLVALRDRVPIDPIDLVLLTAPVDNELLTDEDRQALAEADADPTLPIPAAEIWKQLGIG